MQARNVRDAFGNAAGHDARGPAERSVPLTLVLVLPAVHGDSGADAEHTDGSQQEAHRQRSAYHAVRLEDNACCDKCRQCDDVHREHEPEHLGPKRSGSV
eukprot:scaffold12641_cov71-Phaeocystis_antarctica.AAC.3